MINNNDLKRCFYFEIAYVKSQLKSFCKSFYAFIDKITSARLEKGIKQEAGFIHSLITIITVRRWIYIETIELYGEESKDEVLDWIDQILGLKSSMGHFLNIKPEQKNKLGTWYDFSKIRKLGNVFIDNFDKAMEKAAKTDSSLYEELKKLYSSYICLRGKLSRIYNEK